MSVKIQSLYGSNFTSKEAILLINLGSPKSPKPRDVGAYLDEFLMDERIIALPYLFRALLVKGLIVPTRKKYSARNYATIWDEKAKCFPLIQNTAKIAEKLSQAIERPVALAMRYAEPSMDKALKALKALNPQKVIVLPLYPHYTQSSFGTAVEHCLKRNEALGLELNLVVSKAFYKQKDYRQALTESIRPYLQEDFDKLIISMHGIPLSHLDKPCRKNNGYHKHCLETPHSQTEAEHCYRLQCETSVQFLKEDLGLRDEQIELVYQSRVGHTEWIKPYLAERIDKLPKEGVKKILIACPGFVCDCLETLQEIDIAYRQTFLANGGESFTYIPCLNASPSFISALRRIITQGELRLIKTVCECSDLCYLT